MSGFHYEFRPSKANANVDCLSRFPTSKAQVEPETTAAHVFHIGVIPVSRSQIERETRKDPVLSKEVRYVHDDWLSKLPEVDLALRTYFHKRN